METVVSILLFCLVALSFGATVWVSLRCRRVVFRQKMLLEQQKESLEQQIEKAQDALQAKSDFLSRMSHEIRTPLNAIIGMAQIAQNASEANKVKDCMCKIEHSSEHLLGIINDILDFSKIESGGMELEQKLFSLTQDLNFVLSMVQVKAEEKNIQLMAKANVIEHDGIETDMLRLNQVLINLLSNAIKFTGPGGTVSLEVEELAHMDGESYFQFTVQDSGVGIDPLQAKKLFTPFSQANASVARVYGGTGLGLAISQRIVQMMGGDIGVETVLGEGSVFQFSIRVPAQQTAPKAGPGGWSAVECLHLEGARILVVDDIEINREVVEGMLDGSGAAIDQAADGRQAVELFCSSAVHGYDLILMDMQMPVMDGCAAAREIRTCGREDAQTVKIIAMTANVLPEDIQKALEAGMDGYLPKPIDMVMLSQKLGEWL